MRNCLLPPPEEADLAADLLDQAADALVRGERELAENLLNEANLPALHRYAAHVMSAPPKLLQLRRVGQPRAVLSVADRGIMRMPSGDGVRAIMQRDGYRCRYCGCRVVSRGVRSALSALFPQVVRWPGGKGGDAGKHAAFFALNAVLDHVVPHSRGGDSSPTNLVTTCWPCNFGKEEHLLDELALADPRERAPLVDQWDGLQRVLGLGRVKSVQQTRSPVKPKPRADRQMLEDWLQSMPEAVELARLLGSLRDLGATISVSRNITVNIYRDGSQLSILSIDAAGDVDVPWSIGGQKAWFLAFARALAGAVPGASLYETPMMWRVDGSGRGRGQVTVAELVGASDEVVNGVRDLLDG